MKKSLAFLFLLVLPVVCITLSCGGDDDDPVTVNVTGCWEGGFAGTNFPLSGEMAADFVQTGTNIDGIITFTIEGASSSHTVTGSVSGNAIQFSIDDGCTITQYTGTVSGNTITGTRVTPATPEDHIGTFNLDKTCQI